MNSLLVNLLAILAFFQSGEGSPPADLLLTKTYCNARFGYCIEYLDALVPQEEAPNGDGTVFKNKQGEKILTVFGRPKQDANGHPISLEKQFSADISALKNASYSISYQKIDNGFYVISGFSRNKIFYRKVIAKGNALCFAVLEYPNGEKSIYDQYSEVIFRTFE